MARTFYRIVSSDPPTVTDFASDRVRGKPPPFDPELAQLHDGLSVFATLTQARRKARAFPVLGGYVAVLRLTDAAPIRFERTLPSSGGHHTLWGEPEALLASVESVVTVERHQDEGA